MSKILGYTTTSAMEDLAAFIARAEAEYEALAQAIGEIDEKIASLGKDWNPRPLAFWSPVLQTMLPVIRQATANCLDLFSCKGSEAAPIPLIICVTGITYTVDLHWAAEKLEEAGILLTAHLRGSVPRSIEAQIRERQRLLHALQQLSKAVHEAVDNGRVKLKEAEGEQRRLLTPITSPKPVPPIRLVVEERQRRNIDE